MDHYNIVWKLLNQIAMLKCIKSICLTLKVIMLTFTSIKVNTSKTNGSEIGGIWIRTWNVLFAMTF